MTTFTFVFEDIGFWEKIPDYLESWSCIGTGPSETTRPRILLSCSKSQKLRRVMKENSRPSRNFKLVSGLPVESMPKLQISQQCRYFGELSRITVVDQWERKMMILLLNRYGHKPIYKLGIARSEPHWGLLGSTQHPTVLVMFLWLAHTLERWKVGWLLYRWCGGIGTTSPANCCGLVGSKRSVWRGSLGMLGGGDILKVQGRAWSVFSSYSE